MTDLFKEKAGEWDQNDMVKQLSAAVGSAILANVPLHKAMTVMDFGAGTGLITKQIANHVQEIVAVDTSRAMLDKLADKPGLQDKVTVVCQDILEAPLQQTFDLIVSAMAMHHVKHTGLLIQRLYEHMKPGAILALADLDEEDGSFHPADTEGVYHAGFERNALQSLLEKHGFRNICFMTAHTVVKEDKHYPVFLVTAKRQ